MAGCELISDVCAWLSQVHRVAAEAEMARNLASIEALATTQTQLRRAEQHAREGRNYARAAKLATRWEELESLQVSLTQPP